MSGARDYKSSSEAITIFKKPQKKTTNYTLHALLFLHDIIIISIIIIIISSSSSSSSSSIATTTAAATTTTTTREIGVKIDRTVPDDIPVPPCPDWSALCTGLPPAVPWWPLVLVQTP